MVVARELAALEGYTGGADAFDGSITAQHGATSAHAAQWLGLERAQMLAAELPLLQERQREEERGRQEAQALDHQTSEQLEVLELLTTSRELMPWLHKHGQVMTKEELAKGRHWDLKREHYGEHTGIEGSWNTGRTLWSTREEEEMDWRMRDERG